MLWENTAINQLLKLLEHIECGSITITTPEDKLHSFQGKQRGAHGQISIRDWRMLPMVAAKGDIGMTEAYRDELWDSPDVTQLLLVILQNESIFESYIHGGTVSRMVSRLLYHFTRNTLRGSKRNIQAHYDLGNAFYRLWLDPGMSYSSALFQQDESLEQAQNHKYDRMLERLDAPSGKLLEVGCGWGGLAERALEKYDYSVKGITLSEQQQSYAAKRLNGKAQIVLEDYRKQKGLYNHIISIEMFEAVGEKFWPTYFQKLKSLLHQKGKAVIQTITIDERYFDAYRNGSDMIRTFIFPGGMLPSSTRFHQEAAKADMRVTDRFAFGADYARTLQHWLDNFEARLPQVRALGFDEAFIRMWRFYLAVCIAGFKTDRTSVMQFELQHA